MISESQTRYGSRVFCQGSVLRPCVRCQRTTRPAKPDRITSRGLEGLLRVGRLRNHLRRRQVRSQLAELGVEHVERVLLRLDLADAVVQAARGLLDALD